MKELENNFIDSYNSYSDDIFRFAIFKLNDREKAKDILQETFIKTWIYITKNGEVDNIKAFLYKTAKNGIIDEYRKRGRRDMKTDSLDELSEVGFDPGFDDTEKIFDRIDGEQALTLIKELPEIYSEVLFLKFSESMNVQEIAEVVEETENTVSVRINRGIKKLKKIILDKENKS